MTEQTPPEGFQPDRREMAADELARLKNKLAAERTGSQGAAQRIVAEQAADERLWFRPVYITEDCLQKALRRLHAAVEGKSPEECALAAVTEPRTSPTTTEDK
jgi:hypothetical protein